MSDIDVPKDEATVAPTASPAPNDRNALRRKALQYSVEKETRKAVVFEEMETERSIGDAKTARLRALRLAKEAAEAPAAVKPAAVLKKRPTVINTH
jgi:hypothetical protein